MQQISDIAHEGPISIHPLSMLIRKIENRPGTSDELPYTWKTKEQRYKEKEQRYKEEYPEQWLNMITHQLAESIGNSPEEIIRTAGAVTGSSGGAANLLEGLIDDNRKPK